MEPIPQDKLQAAVAYCTQSARLSAYWAQAPQNARPYILLRFYAATFPDEITADEYETRRDEAASVLGPDDIQFLLQNEKEIEEVKFLISLRSRASSPSSPSSSSSTSPPSSASSSASSSPGGTRPAPCGSLGARPSASGNLTPSAQANPRASSATALYVVLGVLCVLAAVAVWFFARRSSSPQREEQEVPNEVRPFAEASSAQTAQGRPHVQPAQTTGVPPAAASLPADKNPTSVGVETPFAKQSGNAPLAQDAVPPQAVAEVSPAAYAPAPGKTLQSLGGIRFGAPHPGATIARELLFPGDSIASCGLGRAVKGPLLKRKFLSFSDQPILWTSSKTYSVYRIEFTWEGRQRPEEAIAEVASALEARFSVKSEALPAGEGVVLRTGETVISVCLVDSPLQGVGRQVQMRVEHIGAKKAAKSEFDECRREMMSDFDASTLFASGYPNGGMATKRRAASQKTNFPRSFCGVMFGSLPTPGTRTMVIPQTGMHAFPLDYTGRVPGAFKGFSRGMAEFTYERGVHAVELHCIQPPEELTKDEWTDNVRETLARRFESRSGDAANALTDRSLPAVFQSGTLEVTLAEDPQGGLLLRAEDKSIAPVHEHSKKGRSNENG